ncbi:MAG TPA: hypothetical protein VGJ67_04070, partial [Actinomycetota bacterium]
MANTSSGEERLRLAAPKGDVSAAWTPASFAIAYTDEQAPPRRTQAVPVLVLAPGAGSNLDHLFLKGFTEAIARL